MVYKTPYELVEGGLKHSLRSFPRVPYLVLLFSLGNVYSKKLVLLLASGGKKWSFYICGTGNGGKKWDSVLV